ncbi:ATP-binding cassette domain-containing protein [Paenibacillus sp. GCM10027626]|uniref:ATP-binding cassette domain-containing protein n=1 Tax=Paenibacillus sp. GCM10027626 TaxID=3273411 RepID=UPI00363F4C8F
MIELQYVEKRYRPANRVALYIDHLTIPTGEIVGVLGSNGSGKTTLLKAIMGIGELSNGTVLIDGRAVGEQYERLAFMTEEGSYWPSMTAEEYCKFLADFFPRFNTERYERLLRFWSLPSKRKIRSFSRGEKAKLELCAGYAKCADYMLLDEPFLGKDKFARLDFLKLLVGSMEGKETILLSTHIIDEIDNVIDRAIILHEGRLKDDIYIDDLRSQGKDLTELMAQAIGYNAGGYRQVLD